jgi:NAD(P)-dependent dehydrogenase (short-subunit alcohol dehydrogenase family)
MPDKQIALVTGANQGIGFQIAKDLVGSRNLERGETAAREIGAGAVAVQLDVTDRISVDAAAARIQAEFGRLDLLIQNAAISNTGLRAGMSIEDYSKSTRPSVVSIAEMRAVWDTNVFGVLAVYQAMLPLLRASPVSRIVNVSSGVGSLTINSDKAFHYRAIFGPVYPASKTAMNALIVAMAIELEPEGIKVSAVSPGYTKTALNGFQGTETLEEGAREAVRVALLGREGPTGGFTRWEGETIPW